MLQFFAQWRVQQVVVSTLNLIAGQNLVGETLGPADEAEYVALRDRFDAMITAGRHLGLSMHAWLAAPQKRCREKGYAGLRA